MATIRECGVDSEIRDLLPAHSCNCWLVGRLERPSRQLLLDSVQTSLKRTFAVCRGELVPCRGEHIRNFSGKLMMKMAHRIVPVCGWWIRERKLHSTKYRFLVELR